MSTHSREQGAPAIAAAFCAARGEGRSALITYLTAGYPTPADTPHLVDALQTGGADVIELGVPFSDPVADGPTIQAAGQAALEAGITPRACLELVHSLRGRGVTVPLVLMGYYNPVYAYGLEAYAHDCARVGVDGLIVPDLPLEEAAPLRAACQREDVALIQLAAPTSDAERLARLAAATEGFLYVVSRMGTTGASQSLAQDLEQRLAVARRHARTPLAVGFGVSTPEQARALAPLADGVVVGSAVVERAAEGPDTLRDYVASLRGALVREPAG